MGWPRMTRRRFLRLATYSTVAGVGLYTWRIEPHWVEVVERDMAFENLPDVLQGKRLIQLSDLHIGPQVEDAYLIETFREIHALEPDVLVLTGDFMTTREESPYEQVARVLEHLRPARLATLAVLGNHDFGPGWNNHKTADRLVRRLEGAGIEVLRNARKDVAGLQVVGFDDLWSGLFEPAKVLPGLDPERPSLALCHNPDGADEPVWPAFRGWILSGHTHGGQCRPPFLPPPFVPVKNRRYVAGEVDLGAGRRLYVNRGLGHLLRARFNARPEVTVFTLKFGPGFVPHPGL